MLSSDFIHSFKALKIIYLFVFLYEKDYIFFCTTTPYIFNVLFANDDDNVFLEF